MWKIHGKIYDLTNFLDLHPGGKNILKICEGNEDLTATFESYHAMCDMNKINKLMNI
jgi:cytochrome b involved in lipid metabolism